MSLQVWLPLNRDLENKGLSSVTVTNSGATINSAGKIGSCYQFNGSNQKILATFPSSISTAVGSLACWVKFNALPANNGWMNLMQLGAAGGFAACRLGIYFEYGTGINISINGSSTNQNYKAYSFTIGVWYHICATYDGTNVKLYINGVEQLSKTATVGSYTTAVNTLHIGGTNHYWLNGYMNDCRYYDHALSAKEVEEISKGLVLHYQLADLTTEETTNLCNNLQKGGRTTLSTNPLMITTTGEDRDTYWYVKTSSALIGGNTYTLSLQCSGLAPGEYFQFGIGAQSGANNCGQFAIYNGYNEKTFTLASGLDRVSQFILDDSAYSSGVRSKQISFYNVQLEAKDHATGYAGVGGTRTPTTVYDSSGYNNNGTITGSLAVIAGSPKFDRATKFNGSSYIKTIPFNFSTSDWTVSFWYYRTAQPSAYEGFLCLSKGNGVDANKKFAAMPNNGYIWFKCESGNGTLSSLKTTSWTNIIWTSTGKVYENGVEKLTITPGTILTDCTDLVIGARAAATNATNITCLLNNSNISDVRIYATAFSAAQVQELYRTSLLVDSNGNMTPRGNS